MSIRLWLTEEAWAEIAPILTAIKSHAGSPPVLSDRMCIEAVLSLARTGTPWRDLPKEFGHWDAGSNRFRHWERRGLWRQLWERLQTDACPLPPSLYRCDDWPRPSACRGRVKKKADTPHRLWAALGAAVRPKYMRAVAMSAPASRSS